MKAVVAAFNQEKALVGAFSVITNLRMELFEALIFTRGVPRNPAQHSTQLPDNLGDGPQSPPTPPTPIHPILRRSLD